MRHSSKKKAQNEKFIFSHVEVLYIFMLFHVGARGEKERETPKINSAASWICVMAWRVLIFLLGKICVHHKFSYGACIFIVSRFSSMSFECEWKFSFKSISSIWINMNLYEICLRYLLLSSGFHFFPLHPCLSYNIVHLNNNVNSVSKWHEGMKISRKWRKRKMHKDMK